MLNQWKKGVKYFIEGKQTHQKYEKDGETKYFSSIVAYKLIPLDKHEASQDSQNRPFDIPEQEANPNDDSLPF